MVAHSPKGAYRMYSRQRQQLIAQRISTQGSVSVADLAEHFDVSPETVRRDLAALEAAGRLERTHGGAVAPSGHAERSLSARTQEHRSAKTAIARLAAEYLPSSGGSIIIDAGSTTAHLVGRMPASTLTGRGALSIYTDSAPIAAELASSNTAQLYLFGGMVRGITGALVGSSTVDAIRRTRVDVAFIGTNGISAERGLTTPDPAEAAVKSAMVASARKVVVLADESKFSVDHVVEFASLDSVDVLVGNSAPPSPLASALDTANVEVVYP